MSLGRWALSAFFVWHVIAIGLGSLASPGAVLPVGPPRHPGNDPIAAAVTPRLDTLAAAVAPIPNRISGAAAPLQPLVGRYLQLTGVSQSWKMFSNPPEVHQYLRVRYFVGSDRNGPDPTWTATELILPAHREDELRLLNAYWASFRDKAVTSALQRFHQTRDARVLRENTRSADLPDHVAPIARYFARRFTSEALRDDERILRTEVWYGIAPMPSPGETADDLQTAARLDVLSQYYGGPVENHLGRPVIPPYHAAEQEASITWFLEYFEP
jgi:hypothetical protein